MYFYRLWQRYYEEVKSKTVERVIKKVEGASKMNYHNFGDCPIIREIESIIEMRRRIGR